MHLKGENGEIMLESIIVMTITLFMLVWILGIAFIYYQRYVLTAVVNDAAVRIADTYVYPSTDPVIGYMEPDDFTNRDLYRLFSDNSFTEKSKEKAKNYVEYYLKKTNFTGTIDVVDVYLTVYKDSPLRRHIEITAKCRFNTPFGFALDFFGMDGAFTYSATGRADCTDTIDFISTVDYFKRVTTGADISSKGKKVVNSVAKLVYKLKDYFNHNFN